MIEIFVPSTEHKKCLDKSLCSDSNHQIKKLSQSNIFNTPSSGREFSLTPKHYLENPVW